MTSDSTDSNQPAPRSVDGYLSAALDWIQRHCLFHLVRTHKGWFGPRSDAPVDLWVLGHLVLAAATYALSFYLSFTYAINVTLGTLVILYSAWRIIELVTFLLNQLVSARGGPGGVPRVASYERSFVLAIANYFEVTLWFAAWYSIFVRWGSLFVEPSLPRPLSIFRESLAMMLVNTSNSFLPTPSRFVWSAMCFQSVVGLFLTLVVVARTVASLPRPELDNQEPPPPHPNRP
jgi:hypothetical protein